MKATIFYQQNEIGICPQLQVIDQSMGGLGGTFIPNEFYINKLQQTIHSITTDLAFNTFGDLLLNVQLDNGYFIHGIGGIIIEDFIEFPNEAINLTIAGVDWHVLNDYFGNSNSDAFVKEPWSSISIRQKLSFETELSREIGRQEANKYFALATDQRNDDVLFYTIDSTTKYKYIVVHLTWSGQIENQETLSSITFQEFHDFIQQKMAVDHKVWNE